MLAVDGGGVKTDLALLDSSGALLSLVRGGRSQAHHLGVEACVIADDERARLVVNASHSDPAPLAAPDLDTLTPR